MLVLLATIAAFLVDVFAGPALLDGGRLYLGAALVFFLVRAESTGSALASAVAYGLLSDVLGVALPFGTLVLAHGILWLALFGARRSVAHANRRRTFAGLSVTLAAYAVWLELVERFAMFLFADIAIAPIGGAALPAFSASAITLAVCVVFISALRVTRSRAQKWFFIK